MMMMMMMMIVMMMKTVYFNLSWRPQGAELQG